MEALVYFLYFLLTCFFVALVLGIVNGTSKKYLIQTLEETEANFTKICWNVFYSYLVIMLIVVVYVLISFSFISLSFSTTWMPLTLIGGVISCYYLYLFILSLVLVIRFYSNIEMKEITKPLVFSLIVQIVNQFIPFVVFVIPIYLIRRKKQRELLKMFREKEQEKIKNWFRNIYKKIKN